MQYTRDLRIIRDVHWNNFDIAATVFRRVEHRWMDGWWWCWWWKRQNTTTTHFDLSIFGWLVGCVGWLAYCRRICKSVLLLLFRSLSVYSVPIFNLVGIERLLFVVDLNASDYVNWIFLSVSFIFWWHVQFFLSTSVYIWFALSIPWVYFHWHQHKQIKTRRNRINGKLRI